MYAVPPVPENCGRARKKYEMVVPGLVGFSISYTYGEALLIAVLEHPEIVNNSPRCFRRFASGEASWKYGPKPTPAFVLAPKLLFWELKVMNVGDSV